MENLSDKPDRHTVELMESLAAITGLRIHYWVDNTPMVLPWGTVASPASEPAAWSPHTNDGDAFRLMVRFGVGVRDWPQSGSAAQRAQEVRMQIIRSVIDMHPLRQRAENE